MIWNMRVVGSEVLSSGTSHLKCYICFKKLFAFAQGRQESRLRTPVNELAFQVQLPEVATLSVARSLNSSRVDDD